MRSSALGSFLVRPEIGGHDLRVADHALRHVIGNLLAVIEDHDAACRLCQGTGDCHRCEGTGMRLRKNWFGLKRVIKCGNCRGSGQCEMCGGSGKLSLTRPTQG